ncbi:MAG: class II aldolase family protein [Sulfobacillus benefaciens]|uniref:Class II aldolase family protein n=1 Tax=Sulfobacillus benefaciens TaxID=453960 RepID=A0A2T2WQU0_9FIRM|nr:MAG: class II aldolase family protein [Sulfobacillus benefaciens]
MATTLSAAHTHVAELIAASRTLKDSGMLFRGAHANLSVRLDNDSMLMTSGGNVAALTPGDFAVVSLDGRVIEGTMAATMGEIIEMHAGIYRVRSDIGSVIHTHAPHITTFALAHRAIPLVYEPLLRFGLTEEVPVVPWAPRGSQESVQGILDKVVNHPGVFAVMLANHGALAFASDLSSTVQLLTTLDEAAEMLILAESLGGAKPLPDLAIEQVRERMKSFGSHR